MTFVEYLRVRRALLVYTIAVAVVTLVTVITGFAAHGSVSTGIGPHAATTAYTLRDAIAAQYARQGTRVPAFMLFVIAGFGAMILGSVFAGYLSAEREHTPLAWTKPASRERFALAYMGVDVAGMIATFLITLFVGVLGVLWGLGMLPFVSFAPSVWTALLIEGGLALAFYGLVRLVSLTFPGRGGAVVGASWVICYVVGALCAAPLPAPFHAALVALNYLNPVAYFSQMKADGTTAGIMPFAESTRIACVWLLAVVYGAAAIALYRRVEA